MSGEYRRIGTAKLWHGSSMRALRQKSRDGHDMLIYCLTCPMGNYAGIFVLPVAYASEDLRWSKARILRALQLLAGDGHIHYDPGASVVYLPQVLEWDPAGQERQFAGIVRRLESLPETPLTAIFKADLLNRGLVKYGEKARPLLEYFGLTPVRQQSHTDETPTQAQAPSQAHTQAQAPTAPGAEGNYPKLPVRGNGNGRTDGPPLTEAERFFEEVLLPLTNEPHHRDEWLRALQEPGAMEAAESAADALNGALGRGGVRNPGAFVWKKFQEQRRVQ
jgi:hypothetical protein